ncbi:MAG: hypothetical protein EXR72_21960 [Myxococcales bacterium]|nr:hypothetical protein [Myxococcales bacterium]
MAARRWIGGAGLAVVGLGAGFAALVRPRLFEAPDELSSPPVVSRLPSLVAEVGDEASRRAGSKAAADRPPEDLARVEILGTLERVKPRATSCYDLYGQAGLATVKMSVASNGRVTSAKALGDFEGTQTGVCVEAAARSAQFRPFKRPLITLTWQVALKGDEAPAESE